MIFFPERELLIKTSKLGSPLMEKQNVNESFFQKKVCPIDTLRFKDRGVDLICVMTCAILLAWIYFFSSNIRVPWSECCFSPDRSKAIYDFIQDLIVIILLDPDYCAIITNIAVLTCAGPSQSPQTVSLGGP